MRVQRPVGDYDVRPDLVQPGRYGLDGGLVSLQLFVGVLKELGCRSEDFAGGGSLTPPDHPFGLAADLAVATETGPVSHSRQITFPTDHEAANIGCSNRNLLMNSLSLHNSPHAWRRTTFSIFCLILGVNAWGADSAPLRAGMIGLDTSHVPAFTRLFNNAKATGDLA